jgi:hypothetical protein
MQSPAQPGPPRFVPPPGVRAASLEPHGQTVQNCHYDQQRRDNENERLDVIHSRKLGPSMPMSNSRIDAPQRARPLSLPCPSEAPCFPNGGGELLKCVLADL